MTDELIAVVPAAGVGRRMGADRPKQYLKLGKQTILEHTLQRLLAFPAVSQLILALGADDEYASELAILRDPRIIRVEGGRERADSVLHALAKAKAPWVMVHDAARPCITHEDLKKLWDTARSDGVGALLAAPVRDTMKRGDLSGRVAQTVCRERLWHALTPQLFRTELLYRALEQAGEAGLEVTDESSAMEFAGYHPALVEGRFDNIKITHPKDLRLAEIFMQLQESNG
ncbi:2-C-methyl-D-erythritol 4-phosphate cytidylyltransferase [Dongshaea marina]|uniref:2-C-methyl-D-erythritol 4-phosphate cytidylyltransferase n=1 Tax=Dongshaea marina TaxID=2047966 RepID=UPI000D3EBF92|nr:2-C-methyl-D-erythritol 4-phosphate cytidylyltransferase [Dongshaea marina]